MAKKEWSLEGYRAFNDALAQRLNGGPMDELKKWAERGAAAQRAVDELGVFDSTDLADIQLAKLFVSRIHKVAARVADPALRVELYELADDVEARLSR